MAVETPDEDVTAAEVHEALMHANASAKRLPRVVGSPVLPSPWDKSHERINDWLDMLEMLP